MSGEQGGVYFPVRSGFCDDQCARQVRRRFGHQGFDAYVKLLCLLLREDGGRLSLALDDDWDDLGDQLYGMDRERLKEFISVLAHYGAVVCEGQVLYSPLVSESMVAFTESRDAKSRAARARWDKERKLRGKGADAGDNATHDALH